MLQITFTLRNFRLYSCNNAINIRHTWKTRNEDISWILYTSQFEIYFCYHIIFFYESKQNAVNKI